jgi:hypothetical protein
MHDAADLKKIYEILHIRDCVRLAMRPPEVRRVMKNSRFTAHLEGMARIKEESAIDLKH